MNILQVVYQQLPIEVNCVSLLLYVMIWKNSRVLNFFYLH